MEEDERAHVGHNLVQPPAETQIEHTVMAPPVPCCRPSQKDCPNKSGRSSIIMDLACDLAVRAPCRCVGDRPCSCLAVVVFLPLVQEEFPLLCQQHPGDKTRSFDRQSLKRIQIRRMANLRDLQQQLWKIQGAGWHEHPYALLLDGLDSIAAPTHEESLPAHPAHQSFDPILIRARQSLLMATLIDSANCLTKQKRNQGVSDAAVMIAVSSTSPMGPLSFCIPSSAKSRWAELILESCQTTPRDSNTEETMASRWSVQHRNQCLATYAILHDIAGERRILWDTSGGKSTSVTLS